MLTSMARRKRSYILIFRLRFILLILEKLSTSSEKIQGRGVYSVARRCTLSWCTSRTSWESNLVSFLFSKLGYKPSVCIHGVPSLFITLNVCSFCEYQFFFTSFKWLIASPILTVFLDLYFFHFSSANDSGASILVAPSWLLFRLSCFNSSLKSLSLNQRNTFFWGTKNQFLFGFNWVIGAAKDELLLLACLLWESKVLELLPFHISFRSLNSGR